MEDKKQKYDEMFVNMMIEKIESFEGDWKKPWFYSVNLPQNIDGRQYKGQNLLMLYFLSEKYQFKMPAFMTFNQAKERGVHIEKGSHSFPIVYFSVEISHKIDKHKITSSEYNSLSDSEKEEYNVRRINKIYNVFNVDQTNMKEARPELYQELEAQFKLPDYSEKEGMFSCPSVDEMLSKNGWLCDIKQVEGDKAFFSPSRDVINVPLKGQFTDGEHFYGTLIHEMAHSTGTADRLGRDQTGTFGSDKYAKEELIAELTSAMVCQKLGISKSIQEENVAYLQSWLRELKETPNFLLSIFKEVNAASDMIENKVNEYAPKMEQSYTVEASEPVSHYVSQKESKESLSPSEKKLLQTEKPKRRFKEGEFAYLERVFVEKQGLNFVGGTQIKSSDDVAFLFRNLQDKSVENSFAVYHKKDGEAVVQYLCTGTESATQVSVNAILEGARKISADSVTFVHNHPSGRLIPSKEDFNVHSRIKFALNEYGIGCNDGIIINTTSGKYSTFVDNQSKTEFVPTVDAIKDKRSYKIFEFSKQVFSKGFNPEYLTSLRNEADTARFLSSQRLGDRDKMGFLILDQGVNVVGNIFLTKNNLTEDNFKEVARKIAHDANIYGGRSVILYGRGEISQSLQDKFSTYLSRLSDNAKLLDVQMQPSLGMQQTQTLTDKVVAESNLSIKEPDFVIQSNTFDARAYDKCELRLDQVDWSQFQKVGLTLTELHERGQLSKLLNHDATDMMQVSTQLPGGATLNVPCKFQFSISEEQPSLKVLVSQPNLLIPKEAYGIQFSEADRNALKERGYIGHPVSINGRQREIYVDKELNMVLTRKWDRIGEKQEVAKEIKKEKIKKGLHV